MVTQRANLSIGLDTSRAVAAARRLTGSLNSVRYATSRLTLPFIGGVGLSTLLGTSLLDAAVNAGRAGGSFYQLSQQMYELKVAAGTALLGALDAITPVLLRITDALLDDDGSLSWIGNAGLITGGAIAMGLAVSQVVNGFLHLGTAVGRIASLLKAAAAAQNVNTTSTTANTGATAANTASQAANTGAQTAGTAATAAHTGAMNIQAAAAKRLAIAYRLLGAARAFALGPVGILLGGVGLGLGALALSGGFSGGGGNEPSVAPPQYRSASTNPYIRNETRVTVELDGEVVGRVARESVNRNEG